MPIASAGTPTNAIRIGSTPITRVYSGTNLVFDTAAPAPVLQGLTPTSKTQAQQDAAVQTLWTNWKTYLRQDTSRGWYAVRADAQGGVNAYVAEGQGYGLILSAQIAPYDTSARTIFDGITKYVLDHPSNIDADLHAAEQDANMVTHNGGDSATDGDMDIAMGLLMGHQRWGSSGTYNYLELAVRRINAIKRSLISPTTGLLELGDWSNDGRAVGNPDWTVISRPSDWMIGHFEAFKRATSDTTWDTAITTHMNAVNRLQSAYAASTGLLPDFTTGAPASVTPAPANTLEGPNDGNYYYNACRTPLRLGMAASTSARTAAARMGAWAKTKSGGVPANMPTGYRLDGTTVDANGNAVTAMNYTDMAFIAPFAVGAAAGNDQGWLNALWDYMAASTENKLYYTDSLQLMAMIYLSRTYYIDPLTTATAVDASVRSVTAASVPYNSTSKTVAKPAGTTAGDMLLIVMHCDYGDIANFKVPTGFTTLNTRDTGLNLDKQLIGYKIAGSSEPTSYTMTVPVDADLRVDLLCITNAEANESPVVASAATASSATSHAAPSVNPIKGRNLLVSTASLSATAGGMTFAWTPPSGMTERTDAAANGYVTMTTATQTHNSTSSTGSKTFGLSTSSTAVGALTSSVLVASGTSGGTPPSYAPVSSLASGTSATGSYTFQRSVAYSDGSRTSYYHIDASRASATTSAPLVIHLHGDGYQEYTNMANGVTSSVAYDYMDVAKAHNAIGVIPRTPDTSSQTWYSQAYATDWLVSLINDIKARYNVDTKRIFFSGFSGGAEEITYWIVADNSNLMLGGGAMMLGGGGADGLAFGMQPTTALKSMFPMRWFVGENDVAGATEPPDWSARDTATGGEAFFRNAGFDTDIEIIPGTAHNDSEPYGPFFLNEVINGSNIDYGFDAVAAPSTVTTPPDTTAPTEPTPEPEPAPTGYQATGSNGSGGSWTDTTTTTYRTFSDGTVSSRYRFVGAHVPNKSAAVPLVIHFHGDGAYEYNNPGSFTGPPYMQVAKDIGGIGIIPLTPNSDTTWWSTASSGNWAGNLIRDLMKKYNIDKRRIFLSGFSGGSVMITTTLMTRYHQDYLGGGAKMLGGGGNGTQVGTYSTQLLRDFPMRWHVGSLDDGRNTSDNYNARLYAEQSEATYRNRGFNTKMVYIPGEDHGQSQNDGPAALRSLVNESQAKYGLPSI